MKTIKFNRNILKAVVAALLIMSLNTAVAQSKKQLVRIARIEIDPAQVDSYKKAVKEIGETSLRNEPGVLMLFSVQDKQKLTHFTIMEIYADSAAYQAHLKTAHFRKYKASTQNMVKSLELTDVDPIFAGIKPGVMHQ